MNNKDSRDSIESYISLVSTVVLIVMLTIQVFTRYVLNKSIAWSEEVSRIAFVWTVYGAMVYAARNNKHIRLSFFLMSLPGNAQKIILTIADALWIAMNLLITYQSILYIMRLFKYPFISQTLGINLVYAYFIVPVGFFLKSVRIFQCSLRRFKTTDIELHDSRMDM